MTFQELVSKCAKEKVVICAYSSESGYSTIFFSKMFPNGDRRRIELSFDIADFLLPGGELALDLRIEERLETLRREYDKVQKEVNDAQTSIHPLLCKDLEEKHD